MDVTKNYIFGIVATLARFFLTSIEISWLPLALLLHTDVGLGRDVLGRPEGLGRAVFVYLHVRTSGVQAFLIFMQVGERSFSAPPLQECRLPDFVMCPSTQDRESSPDSSSPRPVSTMFFSS